MTEHCIKAQIQKAKDLKDQYTNDKRKLEVYEGYITKTIIPDLLLCMNCNVDADNVLGFDYGKNSTSYLFGVSFMHTSQISKAKNLIRDINSSNYAAPYMETLHMRDEEKFRKYTQALGESVKRRFMPIVFDMAGGISEFTYKLLKDRFKEYPLIRNNLVGEKEYEKQRQWFLKTQCYEC